MVTLTKTVRFGSQVMAVVFTILTEKHLRIIL
jgi:hypothetical protein